MPPNKNLQRDYFRLAGFLRVISLRLQILATLKLLLVLPSIVILLLLGSFFTQEWKIILPYSPLIYSFLVLFFLGFFLLQGLWRVASRPSLEKIARGLEKNFPDLKDDVTNSLLLYQQLHKSSAPVRVSPGLIAAQIQKTANEVRALPPEEVVNFKKTLSHLRLLLPLLCLFSAVMVFDPQFLNRSMALIFHPLSSLPAGETLITVEPQGLILLRGSPLDIKAKTRGQIPEKLMLLVLPESREPLHLAMQPQGNGTFLYRMASTPFSFRFQAYNGRTASPIYFVQVVDPPEVEKIKLVLIPPSYTGLPQEVKEDGHIEVLKGTMVNLEIKTSKAVREGKLVLNQGNQFLLEAKGDHLTGSFPVFDPGTYTIHLKDDLGFENPEPVPYQIRLIPDLYPEAEITSPVQDLEISGNEVIPVVYTARDDFGVTTIKLSYQREGQDRWLNLKSEIKARSVGPETFKWDMAMLGLIPGERIPFHLEAVDNDSVSGPKVGYSRSFTLAVIDKRSLAGQEGREAQEIADALLGLLGDQLEAAKGKEDLAREMEAIQKKVEQNLKGMENQKERFDLEDLRRNLSSLKDRISEENKDGTLQEMERLALLAEDIARKAGVNEVETLVQEIRNRQNRLRDFLSQPQESGGAKDTQTIMKELQTLEELIRSIMQALNRLAEKMPGEFMNSQKFAGSDFQNILKDLNEMKQKMIDGDTAGALESAQRLLQNLSEMTASLGNARGQAAPESFEKLRGEMNRQSNEVDRIFSEQKRILNETERIDKEINRRMERETEKALNRSRDSLQEALENFNRSLPPGEKDPGEELERLMQNGELEKLSQGAKEMEEGFPEKSESRKFLKELGGIADSLAPKPKENMTPDQKAAFPELSSRQENLGERTDRVKDNLEMMAQIFPGLDSEILKDIQGAAGSMENASKELQEEDTQGSIPKEQEALEGLTRSQDAMKKMAQQMAQRSPAEPGGSSLSLDPRPSMPYGPWDPFPSFPGLASNQPQAKGNTGIDKEEFETPSKDAYQVPKIFREKIMESLKQEIPPQYRQKVERYFQGLTE